jgi:hypothetical protein
MAFLVACAPAVLAGQTAAGISAARLPAVPDTGAAGPVTAATQPSAAVADSTLLAAAPGDSLTTAAPPDTAIPTPVGSLLIEADAESVMVLVDGVARGLAPLRVDSLASGAHTLVLVPPDPASWLTAATTDTVYVDAGREAVRSYTMHRWYAIASIPAGEPVSTNDSLAGFTPLVIPSTNLARGTRILVGGERFRPAAATLDDFVRGTLLVRLEPLSPGDMPPMLAQQDLLPELPSSTPLVISGIAAIGFGVAAAYFKGSADRAADQYLITRDPSLIQERDRNDASAALAVVGLQVSLGFFMYFLLSR